MPARRRGATRRPIPSPEPGAAATDATPPAATDERRHKRGSPLDRKKEPRGTRLELRPDADEPSAPADDAPAAELEPGAAEPILVLDDEMAILASNDEWAFRKADKLQGLLPQRTGGADRRTESEVFDRPTLLVLHKMLVHGVLRSLDFPVSTGKEANVFRGTTPRGGYVAVKIFRVNTSTFKHVLQYIQGDERFEGVTGDKRGLVMAWTQKEFRNLARLYEVGVSVPEPIKALSNVLVMEYLGKKEGHFPRLKEVDLDKPTAQRLWQQVADEYVAAYNEADLVHADLSEYNILVEGADQDPSTWRARIIDVGQAVLKNHPMAYEFLARDLRNISAFFRRHGADAKPEDIRGRLSHERRMTKSKRETEAE